MAELTKKDIKEVFVQSLEPFAGAIQKDIGRLDEKIDGVKVELKREINGVRVELKREINGVRVELKSEIGEVKQVVNEMKENSSALFTKLDEYIIRYDRQYQEFLAMNEHIKRLENQFNDFKVRLEKMETSSI